MGAPIDPMTIAALASIIGSAAGIGGKEGEFGSTYNKNQLSTLDDILKQIKGMKGQSNITQQPTFQQGQDWLSRLFGSDQGFYNAFEAPIMRNYQENIVPDLANRFASMGSGGSLGSTGFRNQLAREGSNLSTNLAALRGGMQQQGIGQALQYAQAPVSNYQQLLQTALQPTQNIYQPPTNPLAGIAGAFAGGIGQGYGQKWGQGMAGQSPSTY